MSRTTHHTLVKCGTGGLLLDLSSGSLFQLNASATFVWERRLAEMAKDKIAEALASTYSLPLKTADEHVSEALAAKASPAPPAPEYIYERSANRYLFSRGDEPALTIDDKGESIELAGRSTKTREEIRNVLLAIAPKLLALRGHYVLHASAVVLGGEISAFCGESGAGKTTTARSLARAGAPPIAEDKLVVRQRDGHVEALIGIEEKLYQWSEAAATLLVNGSRPSSPDLDPANADRSLRLRGIGFIDTERRAADTIVAVPLTPLQGAGSIFRNSFYGSDRAEDWTRQLEGATQIASRVATYELTMPAGTGRLDAAAEALIRRGALR